jgi:hypothetical protein
MIGRANSRPVIKSYFNICIDLKSTSEQKQLNHLLTALQFCDGRHCNKCKQKLTEVCPPLVVRMGITPRTFTTAQGFPDISLPLVAMMGIKPRTFTGSDLYHIIAQMLYLVRIQFGNNGKHSLLSMTL